MAKMPVMEAAVKILEDNQASQQTALYFLGWAYASEKRYGEATPVLTKAAALGGPTGAAAKDLLSKIRTATAAKK
jgi:hypothetical protein